MAGHGLKMYVFPIENGDIPAMLNIAEMELILVTSWFTPNSSEIPLESSPQFSSSIQGEVFLHLFYNRSTSNCGSQCHTRFDSQGFLGCRVDVWDVTALGGIHENCIGITQLA